MFTKKILSLFLMFTIFSCTTHNDKFHQNKKEFSTLKTKKENKNIIINFSADSVELRIDQKLILDNEVVKRLQNDRDLKAEIIGYGDDKKSEVSNNFIGNRRAEKVKEYLTSNNINPYRISINSKGDTLKNSNKTLSGRAVKINLTK